MTVSKRTLGISEASALQSEEELRLLRIEEGKRVERLIWQKRPLVWLRDRLGEKPEDFKWSLRPEYENHTWDGDKDPLAQAWMELAKGNWVGVEAATGTSKTYWLSRVVLWFLDVYQDSLVVTSAPKEAQLKLHLWSELTKVFYKFRKLRPEATMHSLRLRVAGDQIEQDPDLADFSESWQAVGFIAGVGSEEQSATKAQGFHRENMLIITEETPGMSNAVLTAFKNTSIGTNNLILAVGNPDSELDPLHQFCTLSNVMNFRISAYDYPNVVAGAEQLPGAVTSASIERRRIEYGEESPMYQSRVRGISPSQGADSLIKLEWFNQCVGFVPEDNTGYNAVGIDVANSENGDKASLAWFKNSCLSYAQDFACPNATHLAYNVLYEDDVLYARAYHNYYTNKIHELGLTEDFIGVDAVGVGVATINAFLEHGFEVQALQGTFWPEAVPLDDEGKPLYRFASLRAQMYWEFREDLRQKKVGIAIEDQFLLDRIRREAAIPKFVLKASYIQVEGKETIKERMGGKSPNLLDSIVYGNWVRKGYRVKGGALPFIAAAIRNY